MTFAKQFIQKMIKIFPYSSLEKKVKWDTIDRPNYAYGVYHATLQAQALGIDPDELLGQANKVSPDVLSVIKDNPKSVPSFLRLASKKRLSEHDWKKLSQFVESGDLGKKK